MEFCTRRAFLMMASAAGATEPAIKIAVRHILDSRAKYRGDQLRGFRTKIWSEAMRDFGRCGVRLEASEVSGEIRRLPSGNPTFVGLAHGVINIVLTDEIPLQWARGRGVAGVSKLHDGHQLCVLALNHAHAHRIPFLAVNTCVHELLHILLRDVRESRPRGLAGQAREFHVDVLATGLWLFNRCAEARKAAETYVRGRAS